MSALIQGTNEWLNMRRNHIGASDAPVIMGVSPWKSAYSLWEEKVGFRENSPSTYAMQRGLDLEEKARKCFESKTNLIVFPRVMFHSDYNWMMASMDGLDIEEENAVEIKCPGKEDHLVAVNGMIPDKYYPQLQHQMEVCNLEKMFYFSFDGSDGVIVECVRDDKYIKKLLKEERDFYDHMVDFVPPKMSEKDFDVRTDDIWRSSVEEWIRASQELNKWEKTEKELKQHLIEMANGKNTKGAGITVSKILRKGNIDYSKIKEMNGIDLDMYRRDPVEYWKISK
jgi:putative phage-type endonuclease